MNSTKSLRYRSEFQLFKKKMPYLHSLKYFKTIYLSSLLQNDGSFMRMYAFDGLMDTLGRVEVRETRNNSDSLQTLSSMMVVLKQMCLEDCEKVTFLSVTAT